MAAALDAITDTGQFELIATAVLRTARPDLAAIIHTGVSAQRRRNTIAIRHSNPESKGTFLPQVSFKAPQPALLQAAMPARFPT